LADRQNRMIFRVLCGDDEKMVRKKSSWKSLEVTSIEAQLTSLQFSAHADLFSQIFQLDNLPFLFC